jgi:hypothetical protein
VTVTGIFEVLYGLTNEGDLINAGKFAHYYGIGTNTGVIRNELGADYYFGDSPFDNAGLFENWGWAGLASTTLHNLATGVVENNGDLRAGGIKNYGLLINNYRLGQWPDDGCEPYANHGVWKNYYEMRIRDDFLNTGYLLNEGTIYHPHDPFVNQGHLVNENEIDYYQTTANNQGRITNRGDIWIGVGNFAMLVSEPGGLIENSSTIRAVCGSGECASVDNAGAIVNLCGGTVTGDYTGTPPVESITLDVSPDTLTWCEQPPVTFYDVVRGDVGRLSVTGGDFSVATEECLGANVAGTSLPYSVAPFTGKGFWFLARPDGDTYDSNYPSQVAGRDAGIAASGADCP